jgi:diguanylate cyclase (GGDEF)-like protein
LIGSPVLAHNATTVAVSADWFDESTGLPGPAFWQTVLSAESARCSRYRRPATVVLAQAVGFDDVVQMWGRDVALRSVVDVVAVLRAGCRASDYLARLADDQVGLILTETDEIAAINMIERVRDKCDRVLRARAADGRIAFGWAGPAASLSLMDAVTKAEDLLRREVAGE